jgi:hypothetical protein
MKVGRILSERDIGDSVCCDYCSKEYRGDNTHGGFLFGSYATCPDCAPEMEKRIKSYGEERFIKARCPPELSFHDWVMTLRGGNNKITTRELKL